MAHSYNISYSVAAVIITIIIILFVSIHFSARNTISKRYRYFLIAMLVMISLDIISAITNDYFEKVPVVINKLLNGFYFFAGAAVGILFLYYSISVALKDSREKTKRTFYIANICALTIYSISLILNHFFGFFFYFSDTGYTHGSAYYLVNALSIIYVIEALVMFIIKRKRYSVRQLVSLILFFAAFLASFVIQLLVFQDILLTDFGCAVGALFIFVSIETPDYIKLIQTLKELNDLKASLEKQVEARTEELAEEKKSYEKLTLETLSSLAKLVDAKDHYTVGHSFRVAAYAKGMADILDFSPTESEQLYFAGLIHDVGKIGISESILTKPGKLTEGEYKIIKSHSAVGGKILKGINEFPVFEIVAKYHHERFDGTGYPEGVSGYDIPLEARIVAICDSFDAMTSDRSYRKALKDETAINELINGKGTQFDPDLVDIFLKLNEKYDNDVRHHIEDLNPNELYKDIYKE